MCTSILRAACPSCHLLQVRHGRLSAFQRFVQQVFDGFAVKYMASAVALLLYAAPLYFQGPRRRAAASRRHHAVTTPRAMRPACKTPPGRPGRPDAAFNASPAMLPQLKRLPLLD